MDLLNFLSNLMGNGGVQKEKPQLPTNRQQARPLPQQPNAMLPRNRPVTPGYEQAAANYESAFDRGDYNSPYIIGQDPKNFGYPADEVNNYISRQPNNRFQIQGATNPVNQLRRGGTIYTPGEGPQTNFRY